MHYCMEFLVLRQSWIALLILKLSARNCLGNIPFVLFYFWFPSFSTFGAVTALHYSLTSLIIFVIISDLIGRIESFLNVSLYIFLLIENIFIDLNYSICIVKTVKKCVFSRWSFPWNCLKSSGIVRENWRISDFNSIFLIVKKRMIRYVLYYKFSVVWQ